MQNYGNTNSRGSNQERRANHHRLFHRSVIHHYFLGVICKWICKMCWQNSTQDTGRFLTSLVCSNPMLVVGLDSCCSTSSTSEVLMQAMMFYLLLSYPTVSIYKMHKIAANVVSLIDVCHIICVDFVTCWTFFSEVMNCSDGTVFHNVIIIFIIFLFLCTTENPDS